MGYQVSEYKGDDVYSIHTTGDCVVGDEVCFEMATFTGSFRNAKFSGFDRVVGRIVSDSYGAEKQQHTFTIEREDGAKMKIKGRNLYKNGVWRKPWPSEKDRQAVVDEKHCRGDAARAARAVRLNGEFA